MGLYTFVYRHVSNHVVTRNRHYHFLIFVGFLVVVPLPIFKHRRRLSYNKSLLLKGFKVKVVDVVIHGS